MFWVERLTILFGFRREVALDVGELRVKGPQIEREGAFRGIGSARISVVRCRKISYLLSNQLQLDLDDQHLIAGGIPLRIKYPKTFVHIRRPAQRINLAEIPCDTLTSAISMLRC